MDVSIYDFQHRYIGHAKSDEPLSILPRMFATLPTSLRLSLGVKETASVGLDCAKNGHFTKVYMRGRAALQLSTFIQVSHFLYVRSLPSFVVP